MDLLKQYLILGANIVVKKDNIHAITLKSTNKDVPGGKSFIIYKNTTTSKFHMELMKLEIYGQRTFFIFKTTCYNADT